MVAHEKVIVFGPTGNIASVAATTAQKLGAHVALAMRDPNKTIPGLSAEEEKAGNYERVQADLSKPDTVEAAVKKSGATAAFFYLAFGQPDHMRGTIEALKNAGITFAVFLSSYTIQKPIKEITSDDLIPYWHAQVEIQLREVYPENQLVAVRPGGFATNTLNWKPQIQKGEVKLYAKEATFDYITSIDMGEVSGNILARGQQDGEDAVYLYGPEMVTQEKAIATISAALGKDIKVTDVSAQEWMQMQRDEFKLPPGLPEYFVKGMDRIKSGKDAAYNKEHYQKGVDNTQKYAGRPATTFKEWAEANKDRFTSNEVPSLRRAQLEEKK